MVREGERGRGKAEKREGEVGERGGERKTEGEGGKDYQKEGKER